MFFGRTFFLKYENIFPQGNVLLKGDKCMDKINCVGFFVSSLGQGSYSVVLLS